MPIGGGAHGADRAHSYEGRKNPFPGHATRRDLDLSQCKRRGVWPSPAQQDANGKIPSRPGGSTTLALPLASRPFSSSASTLRANRVLVGGAMFTQAWGSGREPSSLVCLCQPCSSRRSLSAAASMARRTRIDDPGRPDDDARSLCPTPLENPSPEDRRATCHEVDEEHHTDVERGRPWTRSVGRPHPEERQPPDHEHADDNECDRLPEARPDRTGGPVPKQR